MLKNYFLVALRNLRRKPVYTFLNLSGLAVGMACGILILLILRHDLSYDDFHDNSERIFRVVTIDSAFGISSQRVGVTLLRLGPAAAAEFPEIESFVRLSPAQQLLLSVENRDFYTGTVFYADSSLFRVFDFELLSGEPEKVLAEPGTIVLAKSMATRLFGEKDPTGETVRLNNGNDLRVTGIVADAPSNSHLVYDAFLNLSGQVGEEDLQTLGGIGMITYFLLESPDASATLEPKLESLLREREVNPAWSVTLQPLADVHLHSSNIIFDFNENKSDMAYVLGLGLVAVFVLLIAALNFMNLSTARSADRAREVGLRKVFGAKQRQLVMQHLGESVIMGMLAFGLALALVELLLPVISSTFGRPVAAGLFSDPWLFVQAFGLALVVSLFAGSYPALVLSGFEPLVVLKGAFKRSPRGEILRKGLVVVQFAASVVIIIGTIVVSDQLNYIMDRDTGYNRENVLALTLNNSELQSGAQVFREELLREPAVHSVSRSSSLPGRGLNRMRVFPEGTTDDDVWITNVLSIDESWLDVLGVRLHSGRNFSSEYGTDQQQAVLINEAAARELGWEEPLGRQILVSGQQRQVVGVLSDFHFASLRHQVEPLIMLYNPNGGGVLSIRLTPGETQAAIASIGKVWNESYPNFPFEYSFLSDEFSQLYSEESHLSAITSWFAVLAIFIACLGLFGLAAYSAESRAREISIRKVMGASVASIMTLLSKEFTKLVLVATVIAAPVGYYLMNRWLEDFAYRIELGPGVFLLAGLVAVLIALITVSWQSTKAALMNPVNSLRSE
jgi:putative ABC transport system permease protein